MTWTTPADLRAQVQRWWDRGELLAELAGAESGFPRRLPLKRPTASELASRFGIHPTMIAQWKRQAAQGMVDVFSGKAGRHEIDQEARIKELHAKIGQLTVERDFLSKAFGR